MRVCGIERARKKAYSYLDSQSKMLLYLECAGPEKLMVTKYCRFVVISIMNRTHTHLCVVAGVFCLSAESYRASKPEKSQDKRQNNQGK